MQRLTNAKRRSHILAPVSDLFQLLYKYLVPQFFAILWSLRSTTQIDFFRLRVYSWVYRFSCTGLFYCLNISKVHVISGLELIRPEALLQGSYFKDMPFNLVSLALSLYETVIKTANSEPVHNKWSLLSAWCLCACVCRMGMYTWVCGRTIRASSSSFLEIKSVGFSINVFFFRLGMLEKLLS